MKKHGGHQKESQLGQECKEASRQGKPRVLDEVEHVEIHGEVVSGVSPCDVIKVGLLD